ncbi:MAG: hypothetical protein Q8P57_01590 [Candidatus Pacearchaeota archaeon]|nr:hypothetical protein [Candidatus Pacearchaeota archaeon]
MVYVTQSGSTWLYLLTEIIGVQTPEGETKVAGIERIGLYGTLEKAEEERAAALEDWNKTFSNLEKLIETNPNIADEIVKEKKRAYGVPQDSRIRMGYEIIPVHAKLEEISIDKWNIPFYCEEGREPQRIL